MTDKRLTLSCLVDGEATSNAFSIRVPSSYTVGHLKGLIKAEKTNDFSDVDADRLTLWHVSIPNDNQGSAITSDALDGKAKLNPMTHLSKLFPENPDDDTYIVVQRPPPVHTTVPAYVSTPLSGDLSDQPRPGMLPPDECDRPNMSDSRHSLFAGDCARVWCSKNKVPFTCFVSPWLDSLELLVDYKIVDRENAHWAHKEWFWFFGYWNGSQATSWEFDLFINISDSSRYKGTVIVRVKSGKLGVYSDRVFFVFEGVKRKLKYAKSSEIPLSRHWYGSIESSSRFNYYIADD
ncbi:hypothetical protein BGZ74_002571, partial [Mortierella antarctica]